MKAAKLKGSEMSLTEGNRKKQGTGTPPKGPKPNIKPPAQKPIDEPLPVERLVSVPEEFVTMLGRAVLMISNPQMDGSHVPKTKQILREMQEMLRKAR